MIFELVEYRKYPEVWWAYIVVTPLAVLVHSLGALCMTIIHPQLRAQARNLVTQ
jgi:hypothetical protein